ncbi:MAG: hypothetical protein OHK0012_23440 [Synechococcales cyanobacterium]
MSDAIPEPYSFELLPDPDVIVRLEKEGKSEQTHFTLDKFVHSCTQAAFIDHTQYSNHLNSNLKFLSSRDFSILRSSDQEGYPAKILFPGKPWMNGKVKVDVRITVRFIPDEPPSTNDSGSPLDDLR